MKTVEQKEVYLVRHTKVAVERDTCYGRSDVALRESFVEEAGQIKEKLASVLGDAVIFSSPLSRCIKLATMLGPSNLITDERIVELDFGRWELKKWDSIEKTELEHWFSNMIHSNTHGGEPFIALYNRSREFWDELMLRNEQCMIIVTHFGIIHSLLSYILDLSLQKSFLINVDYGGITKIRVGKHRTVIEYINR